MANNRIYLKCNYCGETLFLGKSFNTGFYYESYDGRLLQDKLNEFYDKHTYCGDHEGNFSLEYENEPQPLIRCRECELFDAEHEGGIGSCSLDMNVYADDFCSQAIRRKDG